MATVNQILDAIAPELKDYNEDDKAVALSVASSRLSEKHFKNVYNQAVALMAAHLLTIAKRNGASGQVTSYKEGDLSIGYGGLSQANKRLDSTGYGSELLTLIKERTLGAGTAV